MIHSPSNNIFLFSAKEMLEEEQGHKTDEFIFHLE